VVGVRGEGGRMVGVGGCPAKSAKESTTCVCIGVLAIMCVNVCVRAYACKSVCMYFFFTYYFILSSVCSLWPVTIILGFKSVYFIFYLLLHSLFCLFTLACHHSPWARNDDNILLSDHTHTHTHTRELHPVRAP